MNRGSAPGIRAVELPIEQRDQKAQWRCASSTDGNGTPVLVVLVGELCWSILLDHLTDLPPEYCEPNQTEGGPGLVSVSTVDPLQLTGMGGPALMTFSKMVYHFSEKWHVQSVDTLTDGGSDEWMYGENEHAADAGNDHTDDHIDHTDDDQTGDDHTGNDHTGDTVRIQCGQRSHRTHDDNTDDDNTDDDRTGDDHTSDDSCGNDHASDDRIDDNHTGDDRTGDDHTGDDRTGNANVASAFLHHRTVIRGRVTRVFSRESAQSVLDDIDKTVTKMKHDIRDTYRLEECSQTTKQLMNESVRLTLSKTLLNSKLLGVRIEVCPTNSLHRILDPEPDELRAAFQLAKIVQIMALILTDKTSTAVTMFPDMKEDIIRGYDAHHTVTYRQAHHSAEDPLPPSSAYSQRIHTGATHQPSSTRGDFTADLPAADGSVRRLFQPPPPAAGVENAPALVLQPAADPTIVTPEVRQ
jgi:hypothetical protein